MKTTLGKILRNPNSIPWNASMFLPFDSTWCYETPAEILEFELEEEVTPAGLHYALGMQQVQDIISNLLAQCDEVDDELRLRSFLYYYDNDAFIRLH